MAGTVFQPPTDLLGNEIPSRIRSPSVHEAIRVCAWSSLVFFFTAIAEVQDGLAEFDSVVEH